MADDVATLKKQLEEASSHEGQWEELKRTNESLQTLVTLVSQKDNDDAKEVRRLRDKQRSLETENSTLQRRLKEHETKAANSERAAQTARHSLSQAQQRAAEWEKRANEYEQDLESTRSRLDQAEQAQAQLDADYSLVKLQLDERDAEERLAKVGVPFHLYPLQGCSVRLTTCTQDRESKLRDQIAALEESAARLRAETDQAKKAAAVATAAAAASTANTSTRPAVSSRLRQNGYTPSERPDSRASTVYGDSRVNTPTPPANGTHHAPSIRPASPPQQSVWDSVHAPRSGRNVIRMPVTPKAKKSHQTPYYPRAPSPTPSNVSAAPTLQDDGWWS